MVRYIVTYFRTLEIILVDPPRTPMRMFWLCGTFDPPSSICAGGCHCCLSVAPIQAFELAHCPGFSHFRRQAVPVVNYPGAEKIPSVLVLCPSWHQAVIRCVTSGWPSAVSPLEPSSFYLFILLIMAIQISGAVSVV